MRMHASSFYQGLAFASLLPSSWQATATATTSGIAEIDLIFPRNETFAPYPVYPILFAFQNPSLLQKFDSALSWHLDQLDSDSYLLKASSLLRLATINMSIGDPHFIYEANFDLNVEGTFRFSWSLNYTKCSESGDQNTVQSSSSLGSDSKSDSLYFTIKNGSSKPDLVALTSDKTCHDIPSLVCNVTDAQSSCASFSPIIPDPSPCKASINSSVASTISNSITAYACADKRLRANTNISCPSNTSTPSSSSTVASATMASATSAAGLILPHGVWIVSVIGLFMYTFA